MKYFITALTLVATLFVQCGQRILATEPANWTVEYWNNTAQAGTPIQTAEISTIDFESNGQSPAEGVNARVFSARYLGRPQLEAGRYQFELTAQGGARLYVNGALIINEYGAAGAGIYRGEASTVQGENTLRLDFVNHGRSNIRVKLTYQLIDNKIDVIPPGEKIIVKNAPNVAPTATPPAKVGAPAGKASAIKTTSKPWQVEYFNNLYVAGKPVATAQTAKIYFMWGQAAPAKRVLRDGFSARFTKRETFAAGNYRFTARADDGVRLFIDGNLVLNEWRAQPYGTYHTTDIVLSEDEHDLRLDYFDQGGAAALQFFWDKR